MGAEFFLAGSLGELQTDFRRARIQARRSVVDASRFDGVDIGSLHRPDGVWAHARRTFDGSTEGSLLAIEITLGRTEFWELGPGSVGMKTVR